MEEPHEVHIDENKALLEKKPKRIVKTPIQVAELEKFYNDHKYPTEAMKLELAESIGLTEKQVSGWFCHRRLKDKKSPNEEIQTHGKQDRSSGVIQDRASGLRQDSCGSTKQGDNKHSDPKEVESRRFTSATILPTELQFDHRSQSQHNSIMDDDTSSESSLPLEDTFRPQNADRLGIITSKYPTHNELRSVKSRTGPSGYLKLKGRAENAAITAVKRQLGRHYREDGPPLGIEFEPLPPGAFESPVDIPVNQSYYVGDRTALHSPDGSRTFQLPNANKVYERYNPKSYDPVDFDEPGLEIRHASKYRNSLSGRSFPMDGHDDSAGETPVRGPGLRRPENYQRNRTPKVIYGDRIEPTNSDINVKRAELVELGLTRKTLKDDEFDGKRRGIDEYSKRVSVKIHPGNKMRDDEYSKRVSVKIHPGNEMRVTKRGRDEFTHQGYPDVPPRIAKTNRSTGAMTTSLSDDETTSSGN